MLPDLDEHVTGDASTIPETSSEVVRLGPVLVGRRADCQKTLGILSTQHAEHRCERRSTIQLMSHIPSIRLFGVIAGQPGAAASQLPNAPAGTSLATPFRAVAPSYSSLELWIVGPENAILE